MTLTDDECDRILTAANDWEAYSILPHERIAVRAGFAAGIAAAWECIKAADAMRARTARIPEHWAAYDAARAAIAKGTP